MIVKVYSKDACPQCKATIRTLNKNGIEFEEVNTSHDEQAREEALQTGELSAPVLVWSDGTVWSGFRPDKIKEKAAELALV